MEFLYYRSMLLENLLVFCVTQHSLMEEEVSMLLRTIWKPKGISPKSLIFMMPIFFLVSLTSWMQIMVYPSVWFVNPNSPNKADRWHQTNGTQMIMQETCRQCWLHWFWKENCLSQWLVNISVAFNHIFLITEANSLYIYYNSYIFLSNLGRLAHTQSP